jgi:hypothetical protein
LDAQFMCKCGKPMSFATEKCADCGSLGPHAFMGKSGSVAESIDIPRGPRHKESYTPEFVEHPQAAPRPERYVAPPAEDVPAEPRYSAGRMHDDDDSRFPAGMRSHSPILDHIRNLDEEHKETKKRPEKDRASDYEERDERESSFSYGGNGEGEQEQPQPASSSNTVSIIISVVLVLALVITAVYIINNFDEVTKWLASPTVPEVFKPSAE